MRDYQHWIDGVFVNPTSGGVVRDRRPLSGEGVGRIPRGDKADASHAVSAAKRAMEAGPWSIMTATERGRILRRIGDLVTEHAAHLAEIEVRDNGKLLGEVQGQLKAKAECWHYYAGYADKIEGRMMPLEKPGYWRSPRSSPLESSLR